MSDENEVIGLVVVTVGGEDIEVTNITTTETGQWKPVKTMNRQARTTKKTRMSKEFSGKITAVVPKNGRGRVPTLDDAVIKISDPETGELLETYIDCNETTRGKNYQLDNELVVDIDFFALNHVEEGAL